MKPENVKKLNQIKLTMAGIIFYLVCALLSYKLTGVILTGFHWFAPGSTAIFITILGIAIWIEINKIIKSEQEKVE